MASVLLITNIFPPIIGGPAIFIDRLALALSARSHTVTVVCSGEGLVPKGYDDQRPFKICRINLTNRYTYEILIRLCLFWQLLRHRHILVNGLESYVSPIAKILRRAYALKIVGDSVWEQGRNWGILTSDFNAFQSEPVPARLQGVARARTAWIQRAHTIITPGTWLKTIVTSWDVPADRIQVIRNGAPLSTFSHSQPAPRKDKLDIVFVGRLTNWKGVETLLLAMQDLQDIHLTIIGNGPELPMLTTLSHQLGIVEKVTFAGKMEQRDLHHRLCQAHALALPSGYEGLSHTLLEAGAAGLARLASQIGGNADAITHGVDGLLIPYGDVQAWRSALIQLISDDDLRIRLGQAAQVSVANDDFMDSVNAYVDVIEGAKCKK